ncbi:unnamed protein product [Sympodiomycopsis kandeliae]
MPEATESTSSASGIIHFKGHINFRARLVLSLLSSRPVIISSIRSNSLSPGLRDFEASFLRLLEKVTNGSKVEISYTGTTVKFLPGTISGGNVIHDCGTGRGVGYFLEYIAMLAPFAKKELTLTLKGLTSVVGDMGADLLRTVHLPWLSQFLPPSTSLSSPLELRILKRGHAPLGGGEIFFRCPLLPNVSSSGPSGGGSGSGGGGGGGMLRCINFVNPGKVKRIRGIATAARVSPAMANRMVERARKTLNRYIPDLYIFADVYRGEEAGQSPGFSLSLLTQSTTSTSHYSESHSKPGAIPEEVSTEAVHSLLSSLSQGGCIPSALQSHTILMMAISPEDVSRVKLAALNTSAVQMLRDIENVWGVRFLIRRVAQQDTLQVDDEESEEEKEQEPLPIADEFILSCKGVGVRGHRKAT